VFLSRMQDLCPKFNNHIFAVSSVSGGSVGAATFLAALNSTTLNQANVSESPCPQITSFLAHSHDEGDLYELGPLEAKIDSALSNDFVSPLVAGLLFPDFLQWFIPKAFGILDRARALEYTLESATDVFYQNPAENIVKASIQGYWKPEGALPALLMNATDTGTGKRIVIAPFNVNENNGSNTIENNAKDSSDNANNVIVSGGNSNGRVTDPFNQIFAISPPITLLNSSG